MYMKCRVCLDPNKTLMFLKREEPDGNKLISMYESLTNFEWLDGIKTASYLCLQCIDDLKISYEFQRKCLDSYQILKSEVSFEELGNDQIQEEIIIIETDSSLIEAESNKEFEIRSKTQIVDLNEARTKDSYESKTADLNEAETANSDENQTEIIDNAEVPTLQKFKVRHFPPEEIEQAINEFKSRGEQASYKCLVCPYILSTIQAVSVHMAQSHREIWVNWCYLCNEIVDNLSEHKQIHKNETEICKFCRKEVKRSYYIEHLKQHSSDKPYKCDICHKKYSVKSSLSTHYQMYHQKDTESEETNSDCSIDDKVDEIGKKIICRLCAKEFSELDLIKAHLKIHYKGKRCNICNYVFSSRLKLIAHLEQHKGRYFLCSNCGKTFLHKSRLEQHMRVQHSELKPYKCNFCDKTFKLQSVLKVHMTVHSDNKPYKCDFCDYSCKISYRLKQHMKLHKEGEEIVTCSGCAQSFKSKGLLRLHVRDVHNAVLS